MTLFGAIVHFALGCHGEFMEPVIPAELSESELGVVYPPFGGRFNAFSPKYGPIYQDTSCFVIWNRADEQGRISRVNVPCPETMWQWDNCIGVLTGTDNGQCECYPLEDASVQVVSCPKPPKA